MAFIGDLSKMGKLQDRIADLANVPARASRKVAERLYGEVQEEFDRGVDPYGNDWEPLAASTVERGRSAPPLTDSRDMRNSLQITPMRGAGVGMTIDHPALPHQTGWSGTQGEGPARPILPQGSRLPDAWEEIIDEECSKEFRKRSAA
jgi:phage gpG-like protein